MALMHFQPSLQKEIPVLYFSYGSNMSRQRIKQRIASAEFLSVATLAGHRLLFHKWGTDRSGKCDACCTEKQSDSVIGVVYEIDPEEKPTLDRIEGLGYGYAEKTVELRGPDGRPMRAFTYCALKIDPNLKPYHWYKEHVLRGAEAAKLPPEYVESIRAVESIDDPDPARRLEELSIYN